MFLQNKMLDSMVELTAEREIDAITFSLLTALAEMLPVTAAYLWQNDNVSQHALERYGVARAPETGQLLTERARDDLDHAERRIVEVARSNTVLRRPGDGHCHIVPIFNGEVRLGALVLRSEGCLESFLPQIEAMARVYTNYMAVLIEANRDQLTGLQNRRRFESRFLSMLGANGSATPVTATGGDRRRDCGATIWLATCDVDHFKRINDTYGHICGDEVLLKLGQLMRSSFRDDDHIYRFGGEEFVVLMRCNSADDAHIALERFRRMVESEQFPLVGSVTLSVGYTQVQPSDFPPAALDRADQALYFSKENGRNQTHCFEALVAAGQLNSQQAVAEGEIDLF